MKLGTPYLCKDGIARSSFTVTFCMDATTLVLSILDLIDQDSRAHKDYLLMYAKGNTKAVEYVVSEFIDSLTLKEIVDNIKLHYFQCGISTHMIVDTFFAKKVLKKEEDLVTYILTEIQKKCNYLFRKEKEAPRLVAIKEVIDRLLVDITDFYFTSEPDDYNIDPEYVQSPEEEDEEDEDSEE